MKNNMLPNEDHELYDWLVAMADNWRVSGFKRILAQAALVAPMEQYALLRPMLLKMRDDDVSKSREKESL